MAGRYDMEVDKGSAFSETVTWNDSSGSPVDNTGYTAKLQIKEFNEDDPALVSLDSEGHGIVLGGSNGQITITMSSAQTGSLPTGECVYDLLMINPDDTVYRLLQGMVEVNPRVTV